MNYKCESCGAAVDKKDKTCRYCGARVDIKDIKTLDDFVVDSNVITKVSTSSPTVISSSSDSYVSKRGFWGSFLSWINRFFLILFIFGGRGHRK